MFPDIDLNNPLMALPCGLVVALGLSLLVYVSQLRQRQ
jgi:hypothetical protein